MDSKRERKIQLKNALKSMKYGKSGDGHDDFTPLMSEHREESKNRNAANKIGSAWRKTTQRAALKQRVKDGIEYKRDAATKIQRAFKSQKLQKAASYAASVSRAAKANKAIMGGIGDSKIGSAMTRNRQPSVTSVLKGKASAVKAKAGQLGGKVRSKISSWADRARFEVNKRKYQSLDDGAPKKKSWTRKAMKYGAAAYGGAMLGALINEKK